MAKFYKIKFIWIFIINLLIKISFVDSFLTKKNNNIESEKYYYHNINDNLDKVIFNKAHSFENDNKENQTIFENFKNEIPIRFDGDQLLRIYKNGTKDYKGIIHFLENNYNINIWNENNPNSTDFSVTKTSLDDVKTYLKNNNLIYNVSINNVQEAIDNETRTEYRMKRSIRDELIEDGSGFMSWNEYHSLRDIYGMLRHYNRTKPKLCKLYNIGKSNENRNLLVLRISNNNRNNKSIWIDGGIHAREWISPAAVTYMIYHLAENWNSLPDYVKNINWYFMPMVNPDGYEFSRKFNRLWRKNRKQGLLCSGVDLNRNFGFEWDAKGSSSTNPCVETYRGTKPFSEPESQAIANFLNRIKTTLTSYLTFHSYGQYILYPWAYTKSIPKDYKRMRDVGDECAKSANEIAGTVYKVAPAYILGVAGGGSDDWAKATYDLDYVYTIELRDRGEHGFILPVEQIYETCREALRMIKTLAKFVA